MKTFLLILLSLTTLFSSSCTVVPAQQGGYYPQQRPMYGYNGGQANYSNQRSMTGQPRRTDWVAGPVLHERWMYQASSGKIIKVSENTLSPEAAATEMKGKGLDPFPDRIPVGGEMPTVRSNRPH